MNDPRHDGMNTDPPPTKDYERITEATDLTVRWDTQGPGTRVEVEKRISDEALYSMAMQRANDTRGAYTTDSPSEREVLENSIHVWMEGFIHGIVYEEQKKTMSLFQLPDKNLIGAASALVGNWQGEERDLQCSRRVDLKTITHVAWVRSVQAIQMLGITSPRSSELPPFQASHWADGFAMGMLFQELGGHRED